MADPRTASWDAYELLVEISSGELIDKINILKIRLEEIRDAAKRANVAREHAALIVEEKSYAAYGSAREPLYRKAP